MIYEEYLYIRISIVGNKCFGVMHRNGQISLTIINPTSQPQSQQYPDVSTDVLYQQSF